MERFLSAPGKLFLSGEYAVLWGGTARIAAVGPRTHAQVRRRPDREVHVVLEGGRLAGQITPLGVNWGGPVPQPFRFAARAIGEAVRAHGKEDLGLELALSPSPAADGKKLGLGGSARAAVLAAEATRYVLEERVDALKLALLSHALEQGMRGSGGDVAAIFAGGLVRYRRYPVELLERAASQGQLRSGLLSAPPVDLWRVPAERTFLAYAFCGDSASTEQMIRKAERTLSGDERRAFVERSDDLGDQLERALVEGDFRAVREAAGGLRALLSQVGAETDAAKQILALAESHGAAGKTSGAGGGDVCVLFSPDEAARSRVLEALAARGIFARAAPLEAGLRGEAKLDASLANWL